MKLVRPCAPHGALFFLFLISILISFTGSAHTVVLSEYSLEYREGQWVLLFDQKTSQLRDAVYVSRPDLKGINLNSETFLEATANHITTSLALKYRGEFLRIVPQHMHFGGLKFESRFLVEGLADQPDYLTMQVDGFDEHEHSIVLFRVTEGTDAYLNYFNQNQRLATYDFETHSYVFEEIASESKTKLFLYAILILVLLGLVVKLIKTKKVAM